ncbi:MAG: precorrin-8X/cobalt-precorrin-8 methylmutase [Candidatus Poriferisodalaceae bacterium]|jgi:precorrin-8X/cobalt-precorrin-8 methylmutase
MDIFDTVVSVDWSAAASPTTGKDSIWVAIHDNDGLVPPTNFRTRAAFDEWLRGYVADHPNHRLLVGIDISFAAPRGLAEAIGHQPDAGPAWRHVWETIASLITDEDNNRNNRFEVGAELNRRIGDEPGPFWGHPQSQHHRHLLPTRPEYPVVTAAGRRLAEYRVDERRARAAGKAPQSTWKLAYQASVGGQFLTGVARLLEFERDHPDRTRFWPLGTGFRADPASGEIWFSEVWPSSWPLAGDHPIRDANQVETAATALWHANASGDLAIWLQGPKDLSLDDRTAVLNEEGWMLGPAAR